jgi:uracil-DNA glycosylase family 4
MKCSRRVLTQHNGNWNAHVMFVAEAPGRLGAEVTGVPLFGDRTGDRFEELLNVMGWSRSAIFVTNAVLCNPRDCNGNNDRPTTKEIRSCSKLLERTINVVNPQLVVALGRVALEALGAIASHDCDLRSSVGEVIGWHHRYLGVLYHPGPRTVIHRPWADQVKDAKKIADTAKKLKLNVHMQEPDVIDDCGFLTHPATTLDSACELE